MADRPFTVHFRPEVEDDLRRLPAEIRKRVMGAIGDRLATNPEDYGKPLGGPLKGLRRVRTGDYRIAYQVSGRQVIIWAVRHRKDIYQLLESRI